MTKLTNVPIYPSRKWRRYYILKFRGNTFRWPMTLTFDLKFRKYLSVTVYPYVICMPSFIMIGWEMAEILHFEILRKHGQTHTHTHTHKQTNRHGHYNTSPSPYGGRGNKQTISSTNVTIFIHTSLSWMFVWNNLSVDILRYRKLRTKLDKWWELPHKWWTSYVDGNDKSWHKYIKFAFNTELELMYSAKVEHNGGLQYVLPA